MESDIDSWREIIAELCANAPDITIRDCLRLYDPSIPSSKIKLIIQKVKKDDILKTLIYLGPNQEITEKVLKDDAIDMLIVKVKSFFPDICQICDEQYRFKHGSQPFLCCESCGQEVHRECYSKILSEFKLLDEKGLPKLFFKSIPGFHYICQSCELNVIDKNFSKAVAQISLNTQSNELKNTREAEQHLNIGTEHPKEKKDIMCKYYLRGNCQFGIKGKKCQYKHPQACKKLLRHGNKKPRGCNEGKNCKFFHPRMCSNSIKYNKCLDKSCKFVHVKGTLTENSLKYRKDTNLRVPGEIPDASDKERDFLILIQNLKNEILQTMDKKFAEMNKNQPQPPPRLMNQVPNFNQWSTQPIFQHHMHNQHMMQA